ncbi:MAG: hypothetical protein S0880_35775 [Actinomycetota bacterium]|nr:hypothetical protein [Actinomycetota bacterium]
MRVLHVAELRLDHPFEGLARIPASIVDAVRDASLDAFDDLIEAALDERVDAVLVTGGLYRGPEHGLRAQRRVSIATERLARHGIPFVVVRHAGDAEPDAWTAIGSWPSSFVSVGPDEVHTIPLHRDGRTAGTIVAIGADRLDDADAIERALADVDGPRLAATVTNDADRLPDVAVDGWALGGRRDIHVLRHPARERPWIVWAGTHQARATDADARGPKGALLHDTDTVALLELDRVRVVGLTIDVTPLRDLDELADRLAREADDLREVRRHRSIVLRAELVGTGPVHRALADGALGDILADLGDRAGTDRPFLWWERIADRTQPGVDLAAIRRRADLAADLLLVTEDALGADGGRSLAAQWMTGFPRDLDPDGADPTDPPPERWQEALLVALDTVTGG